MKISIDDDVVQKHKRLSVNELLCCLIVKNGENPISVAKNLLKRNFLALSNEELNKMYIDISVSKLCDQILLESDTSVPEVKEVEKLAIQLQEMFPKGRKKDEIGNPKYSWRGNKRDITKRLMAFFKLYGNYSFGSIIEATKRYLSMYEKDNRYMQTLQYFIIKNNESRLATELEGLSDEIVQGDENWTNTVLLLNSKFK